MRITILAAVIGLLVMTSQASAAGGLGFGPGRVDANIKFDVRFHHNNQAGVLGPWYLYWPYEAHFIAPAHPQYPFWPSQYTLPGGMPHAVPPAPMPSYWK